MHIEHRLARNREQRALRRYDALGFPAAKPEAAMLVEVADVAHAVIEIVAIRDGDFRQRRRLRPILVRASDDSAARSNLADFAAWQLEVVGPKCNRLIADANDADINAK